MPDDKLPKGTAPTPLASITPTRRVVLPPRPGPGAGRYKVRAEGPTDLVTAKVDKARLTTEQLKGKGVPGGLKVSTVKETLSSLRTGRDQLSDRIRDDFEKPIDKASIADSLLYVDDFQQEAYAETPGGEARLQVALLYCGGSTNRTFLLTNASLDALAAISTAFRHQLTEERSIKLSGPGGAEWFIFLAPSEVEKTLAAVCEQFPETAPARADALELYVSGGSRNPSGADLPAISPKPREDQYGFALQAPAAGEAAEAEGQWAPARFHISLREALTINNTIQGISLEDLGNAEPVPGSETSQELSKRDHSIHTFYGYEVKLEAEDGSRRFMYTNTRPETLADHGAISHLVTSSHMKIALADGTFAYLVEVCEGASALRMFPSPREDESTSNGQPMFDNFAEAVRWAARRAAGLGRGTVKKQHIGDGRATVLVETPEGSFIITNASVEGAASDIAKACETAEESMAVAIEGDIKSASVTLMSGEAIRISVVPVSTHMSRKPEADLPPSPSAAPASAAQPPAVASPSATGTTETSVLISLDLGVPFDKEGVAALLKSATIPTPKSVLHGDAEATAAFERRRRFLTSIATNVKYVIEHNEKSDPLVFSIVRADIGGQGLSFNLYRLRGGIDELDPALRDLQQSLVFTDSLGWYILMPPTLAAEKRDALLKSTMTR